MAARDHFRAHARRRVDLDATLRLDDGGRNRSAAEASAPQDVRIRDLGLGGACIEIAEPQSDPSAATPRPPGASGVDREASVTLSVMAPTLWDPLTLSGKIAWIRRSGAGRPARAGVRFEHREPTALYALFQLLGAHVYDA